MNIAIVGGRDFSDYTLFKETLLRYISIYGVPENIVSGGAKGADTLAAQFAAEMDIPLLVFKPDYQKYGRGATLVRNTQIIENADVVFAFWDGQSKGTKDSITKAKKLQKELHIIFYREKIEEN
ncbi:hypothetical protein CAPGI0001_1261 [Capnocytophaga gingivalis ATCC 33624]|uniref:DUF2493 domain-containing protein n=1 Tax=Capnocytophaga gingivalis TaxID=1017 RepID=UPI00019FADCE|nr:DUF2493 domain-containing protein [Capnocytophaga gingivalis]EEK14868.1 hypothetical protein CAPGI0001_1261 [Capnocytophaga gingivalis ATCC 33624]